MYELVFLTNRLGYVDCPAKIGVYKINNEEIALIDSGNNKGAATKVLRIAEAEGWKIRMILCTHAHADHIGGNRHIQQKTGCKIFAPVGESDAVRNPIWEPISLFGARPPKALRHGFLLADASEALPLCDAVMPEGLSILPLPGHTQDMVGFRTEDGAVYLADAMASEQTIEKYGIPFLYDPGIYMETLDRIAAMEGKIFVGSHIPPAEDIAKLARYNRAATEKVIDQILSIAAEPIGFEALLAKLFESYALAMSIDQYALVGSTVRSYLSYLLDEGRIEALVENGMLLWKSK